MSQFFPPVHYTDKIPCSPTDDQHRRNQYDVCQGLNMTRLNIALDKLVEQGTIPRALANLYSAQAGTLLAVILSENNRVHGF